MDRAKLQYLDFLQKIFCMYCGYGNGVIAYWGEIAAETEHYWCGVKHKEVPGFRVPEYQKNFTEYGDEGEFKEKYCKLEKK